MKSLLRLFLLTVRDVFDPLVHFQEVSILAYHSISADSVETAIAPEAFEHQLTFLRSRGYAFVTLSVVEAWHDGLENIPHKSIAITFDDGYVDFETQALPILERLQIPATLFFVGDATSSRKAVQNDIPLLDAEGIGRVGKHPLVSLGYHSKTHADLRALSGDAFREELKPPFALASFAYPGGNYTEEAKKELATLGYRFGYSIKPTLVTPKTDRYLMPRTVVTKGMTDEGLRAATTAAAEWYRTLTRFLRSFFEKAALVLFGLLLAFAMTEITVRIFFPEAPRFYIADTYIKTIHEPNAFITRGGGTNEYTATMKTNKQGFIGDENFTPQKPAGTTRIAALGDSFTEGYVVDYHQVYPYVLEQNLNASAAGKKYQVYNFGIAGTGTAHQLLTYEHYVRQYHPDVLVWEFYVGNDFADNLLFQSGAGSPENSGAVKWGGLRDFFSNNFEAPRFILRKLETLQNVQKTLANFSLVSRGLHFYDANTGYPFVYDIYNTSKSTVFDSEFADTCALVGKLHADAQADGIPMVALVIPTKEEVYKDDWQKVLTANPAMKNETWDLQKPLTNITDCLTKNQVPTLSMYKAFSASTAAGGPRLYYVQDDHANPTGQALIAKTLQAYLVGSVLK